MLGCWGGCLGGNTDDVRIRTYHKRAVSASACTEYGVRIRTDSPPYTLLLDWPSAAPCTGGVVFRPAGAQVTINAMAVRYRYGCFKFEHDKHRIISIQQYVVQCRPMSSLLCAPGSMYRWIICNLPARRRTPHSPTNTIDSRQYPRGVVVVVLVVVVVNPTQRIWI
jgi:hypothetical protein